MHPASLQHIRRAESRDLPQLLQKDQHNWLVANVHGRYQLSRGQVMQETADSEHGKSCNTTEVNNQQLTSLIVASLRFSCCFFSALRSFTLAS